MCTEEDQQDGWVHHDAGLCVRAVIEGISIRELHLRARPGEPFLSSAVRKISPLQLVADRHQKTRAVADRTITDTGGRSKPDSFYLRVSQVFTAEVADGNTRPAITIAQRQGVPVTTVHRWLREARNRGFVMPQPAPRRTPRSDAQSRTTA